MSDPNQSVPLAPSQTIDQELGRQPSHPDPIMRYFDFKHLPAHLRATAMIFHETAEVINNTVPDGPEKSAGLRKLLEAKDCCVRACL